MSTSIDDAISLLNVKFTNNNNNTFSWNKNNSFAIGHNS